MSLQLADGLIVACNQRLFGKLVIYKTVVTTIGCFCFIHLLFSFLCQMVKAVVRIAEHPACFEAFPPKTVVELCLPKNPSSRVQIKTTYTIRQTLAFCLFFWIVYTFKNNPVVVIYSEYRLCFVWTLT